MKKLKLFIIPILAIIPFTYIHAANVSTLDASISNKITYSGTTEDDVLAVSCTLYDANNKEIAFKSSSVTNKTFNDSFEYTKGTYTIKCANYEGGTFVSKTISSLTNDIKIETKDNTTEEEKIKEEVANIVTKIISGQKVEGVTDELQNKIKDAYENNKTITVDLVEKEKTESDVEDDAKKIKELISESTITKYYDITIQISIDGTYVGNITKLDNEVELTFKVPENLEKVKEGYTRVFTIVKVHDNKAEKLTTSQDNDNLKTKTNGFSTYAITYQDVKDANNPKTVDNIGSLISLAIISLLGIIVLTLTTKKHN